jgi:endonuclease/exonuclease/phosphatase (EEP) superfamily protein YafD
MWSSGFAGEDRRSTHLLGRLDYLFFRLPPRYRAATMRIEEKFGSDHHPVLSRFSRAAGGEGRHGLQREASFSVYSLIAGGA